MCKQIIKKKKELKGIGLFQLLAQNKMLTNGENSIKDEERTSENKKENMVGCIACESLRVRQGTCHLSDLGFVFFKKKILISGFNGFSCSLNQWLRMKPVPPKQFSKRHPFTTLRHLLINSTAII